MRVTYSKRGDAAYIYLTEREIEPGRTTVEMPQRDGLPWVMLDFKDGRLVGVEVIGAARGLFEDALAKAVEP